MVGLGDVEAFFALKERFKKWRNRNVTEGEESTAARFIALFNSHGVKPSQIPQFFGEGLTAHICNDEQKLMEALTPPMLIKAAQMFAINQDWLEAASDEVYEFKSFYKDPHGFATYLDELVSTAVKESLFCYVVMPHIDEFCIEKKDGFIVLVETFSKMNHREIQRYHFIRYDNAHYWKSRAYLAANCAAVFKRKIPVIGNYMKYRLIEDILSAKKLINYCYEEGYQGIELNTYGSFIIDEMIEKPKSYLEGVDPEREQFGHLAALDLWLQLDEHMNGFSDVSHTQSKELFKAELKKYQ